MARNEVQGRGPHARGRGVQRRGRAGLDPDDAGLARHARAPPARAGDARANRAAALHRRVRRRALRPGRGLPPGLRRGDADPRRRGRSRSTTSTPPTSRTACARPRSALERAEEDSEEARQAAREKRRYEAFVKIAEGLQAARASPRVERRQRAHRELQVRLVGVLGAVWLSPPRLWTNSITVGTPARAIAAASCSGPLGSGSARPPSSPTTAWRVAGPARRRTGSGRSTRSARLDRRRPRRPRRRPPRCSASAQRVQAPRGLVAQVDA